MLSSTAAELIGSTLAAAGLGIVVGVSLIGLSIYCLKNSEEISKKFFKGEELKEKSKK